MATCRRTDARVKQAQIAKAVEFARLIPARCNELRFTTRCPGSARSTADRLAFKVLDLLEKPSETGD
jgi:hypothetical protein